MKEGDKNKLNGGGTNIVISDQESINPINHGSNLIAVHSSQISVSGNSNNNPQHMASAAYNMAN
jgi:hypothetical protein